MLTQGHDRSADYWAYGILIYELICRQTPFEGRTQQRTFEKIVHSTKQLTFPSGFDPHCKSLIRRLLHNNSALRLGALQNGFDDIRSHAFFVMQNVDFEKIRTKEVLMDCRRPERDSAAVAACAVDDFSIAEELTVQVDRDYSEYFEVMALEESIDDVAADMK